MTDMNHPLGSKAVVILQMIGEGYTYEQILAQHPTFTYLDIFQAARLALDMTGGHGRGMAAMAGA